MSKSLVFMFSGQGSQYYQMGREFYEGSPVFRNWLLILDSVAHDIIGDSIIDLIYDKKKRKNDTFDRALYTHPAIFMVEYALFRELLAQGFRPDYVLGASLGEFTSAAVAGVWSPEESLEAVIKQAEHLEEHSNKGGMMAILHTPDLYYDRQIIYENSTLASINYASHFVVSGKNENLKIIEQYLKKEGIIRQALPVDQGFHSSCIEPAASVYTDYIKVKSLIPPQVPLVSCMHADILTNIDNDHFWDIIRRPIEIQKTIKGLEEMQDYVYIDLGPSGTLANFVRYNLAEDSGSESYAIISPFGRDRVNFEKMKKMLSSRNLIKSNKEKIK